MNIKEFRQLTPAEELRILVSNLNVTSEVFNEKYSIEELIKINRMLMLSNLDIFPDEWSQKQIKEALLGIPPSWKTNRFGKIVPNYNDFQFLLNYYDSVAGKLDKKLATTIIDVTYFELNYSVEFKQAEKIIQSWKNGSIKPSIKEQKRIIKWIKLQFAAGSKFGIFDLKKNR